MEVGSDATCEEGDGMAAVVFVLRDGKDLPVKGGDSVGLPFNGVEEASSFIRLLITSAKDTPLDPHGLELDMVKWGKVNNWFVVRQA